MNSEGTPLRIAPEENKTMKKENPMRKIRIEKIVNIDSTSQLLASILSKKISVGSKYILIDIPYGKSAKVSLNQAKSLGEKFIQLGKKFNLKIQIIFTDGSEPIGHGIGPALEINDVIKVLRRENPPSDLEEKSLLLSGKILELAGKAKKNSGIRIAREILESKKALKKFEQIVHAQKGKVVMQKTGKLSFNVHSDKKARIKHIDNLIKDYSEKLKSSFIVVSEGRVRIRRLPK